MNFSDLFANAGKAIKSNAPEILTGVGIVGVVSTAYLTGKAAYESRKLLERDERIGVMPATWERKDRLKYQVKETWRLYIPAAVSGVATIGCVIGAAKGGSKRTAAAVGAYSLTEKAFREYREKVVDELGKTKEEKMRGELTQEHINQTHPSSREIVVLSGGNVLCCEAQTMRYFRSDMETLRKAMNDVNGMINSRLYVTLDEFYDLIGLTHTTDSNFHGWDSDKQMELEFYSGLTPNGEPCLVFDYNYVKMLT